MENATPRNLSNFGMVPEIPEYTAITLDDILRLIFLNYIPPHYMEQKEEDEKQLSDNKPCHWGLERWFYE